MLDPKIICDNLHPIQGQIEQRIIETEFQIASNFLVLAQTLNE